MKDYKLETILLMLDEDKKKLKLRSTQDMTVRLPKEWLAVLNWALDSDIIVSSAFWDKHKKCHKITLEKLTKDNKKKKGKWY